MGLREPFKNLERLDGECVEDCSWAILKKSSLWTLIPGILSTLENEVAVEDKSQLRQKEVIVPT